MAHYSKLSKIVVDVPDTEHDAEVAFWQGALGRELIQFERFPEFHGVELDERGFGLLTQRLGDGPARIHLDIHTTDRQAEVARLKGLGASVVEDGERWTVMRTPAGLVFCVIPDRTLDASNAQLVGEDPAE